MSRKIKIAATQMDANPAPTQERLERAEQLVSSAVQDGAQLVVLPELFNIGYSYRDETHLRAEKIDGLSASWMKSCAARLDIHLAGSILLLDEDEVYNALLLFTPDGRMWRYDKNYPWGWERGFFRDAHRITVAHTDLGDIGMLICWDVAHADLWKRYAGQVDLMLISSCPPDVSNPTYHLADGVELTMDDLGPVAASMKDLGARVFGDVINQQTAWLTVPAINTVGCGHIHTPIPNGYLTMLGILPMAPSIAKYLLVPPRSEKLEISCDFVEGCKIVDAQGQVLSKRTQEQGEGYTVSEVMLADQKPMPSEIQRIPDLPRILYLLSDHILPWISITVYRQGLRKVWGERMAPVQSSTRRWRVLLGLGIGFGFLIGWLTPKKKA
jgi:predicted amidohydrolase